MNKLHVNYEFWSPLISKSSLEEYMPNELKPKFQPG